MRKTYLGLGSNVGDREGNLRKAAAQIGDTYRIFALSSIYETTPVGYRNQPAFLNMVLSIDSESSTPHDLLCFIKSIESKAGREKSFRWGPRLIDIDILYIEGVEVDSEDLTIPHRELLNRKFVLVPLSELTDHLIIKEHRLDIEEQIQKVDPAQGMVFLYKSKSTLELYG